MDYNTISMNIANSNVNPPDIFAKDPCECCPYGFHIDTDFVRYCDALLTALYAHQTNRSTNQFRLNNNNNTNVNYIEQNYDDTVDDDNDKSDLLQNLSFKDIVHLTNNNNYSNDVLKQPDVYDHSLNNSNESIHKIPPVDAFNTNDQLSPTITNSTIDSSSYNKSCQDETLSLSPTISSCLSAGISKTILTQIRNHLALSLQRVEKLENQVAQISVLKEEISKLESERNNLLKKLNEKNAQPLLNDNDKLDQSSTNEKIVNENNNDKNLDKILLTNEKCNSWDLKPAEKPILKSVGTLTNFVPCMTLRNTFVQTDLMSAEIDKNVEMKDSATITDSLPHYTEKHSELNHEKGSQTDFPLESMEIFLSNDNKNQITLDKHLKNDNGYSSQKISLDRVNDFHNLASSNIKLINSTTPTSSTQSIRLCEKCNEMILSDHFGSYACSPDHIKTISLPKIIKTDSGISVERKQIDNKIIEESDNIILVYPSTEFVNIQLSDDVNEICTKDFVKKRKTFVFSNEIKAALKIINDNLFSYEKSFLYAKSVAIVKKNWFKISSSVDSDYRAVECYLDYIEKYSNELVDFIVNLSDTNGNTAIHYAISYNNFDIVSVLLDSKICDVDKFNKAGYTATMLVSLAKIENELYRDIVERLFHQADVNLKAKQNGQTALMLAASHGRVEISKLLLECGAEINLQDNDGSTALMCAAEHGHSEVTSLLLSHSDCDPLIEDNEGSTAFKIALINGHNDIGVLLYSGTRNINSNGSSVLNRSPKRTGSFTHSSLFSTNGQNQRSPPRIRRSSLSTSPLKTDI